MSIRHLKGALLASLGRSVVVGKAQQMFVHRVVCAVCLCRVYDGTLCSATPTVGGRR